MARSFPFIDGWDSYTDLTKKWDAAWGRWAMGGWGQEYPTIQQTGGRRNSGCFKTTWSSSGIRRSRGFSNKATWILGVACKPSLDTPQRICGFLDVTTPQITIRVNMDGSISALLGDPAGFGVAGTVLGTSAVGLIPANAWNYYETKVVFNGSSPATGSVQVRLNGVASPVLNLSGVVTVATANAYANGIYIGSYYNREYDGGTTAYFDDLYIDYDTDAAFRGDCAVLTSFPNGPGYYSEFTPSAGLNYQCVDETDPNETDYVSEGTPGKRDTYAHASLSVSSDATIHVVAVSPCAAKAMPGVAEVAPMIRSGSTDSVGATHTPVAGSFLYQTEMWEADPATAAAWTVGGFNNMQFGQKVIT
jgi:hypothetical protein